MIPYFYQSGIIMSSIRSTLIRSCFSNIQKELNQLEDWLNRDFVELPSAPDASQPRMDSNIIYQAIQQLSKQLDSQQHTLHHIIDRIDVLEETRNIHIDEKDENLWLDKEGVQLQNEMVDNEYEPIINVNKTEEVETTTPTEVAVEPVIIEPVVIEPVVIEPVIIEPVVIEPVVIEPVIAPKEEPVVIEPVVTAVVTEEAPAEEEAEEAEEEEEEDGYEEFEYNGTTYYRDSELNVYLLDDEGQLTDSVGIWREKSQSIKFYKK